MTQNKQHMTTIGILEWFRLGEYQRVEQVLKDLKTLGVTHLRTGVSWADCHTASGQEWYAWLLPRLAQEVDILPCFLYTPPSLGIVPRTAAPPREAKAYADFIDEMITRFGDYFEWIELWNEPNNVSEWDWTLDAEWGIFSEMIGRAAYWAQYRGKKTLLGGMSPVDPNWLKLMGDRGLLTYINAIGIHGFPGNWEYAWEGWNKNIAKVQAVLDQYKSQAKIWITETGFSTWQHDEHRQLGEFVNALNAPVERFYWYGAQDLHPDFPTIDGFHTDEREYHFGLKCTDDSPKLLYRLWASGGLPAVRDIAQMEPQKSGVAVVGIDTAEALVRTLPLQQNHPHTQQRQKSYPLAVGDSKQQPVLITGGAGFIGTNLAQRLLSLGQPVRVLDNLCRPGVEQNLRWLKSQYGDLLQIEIADIRDRFSLRQALKDTSFVFHFAAQVAVTTSVNNPINDFEINALGTINLLEEIRRLTIPLPLIFTSTNKVYGTLPDIQLQLNCTRYQPQKIKTGINEDQPLDFHSPYGCSKGAADQYVLDYARTFNLPAVVFRMSCIYGSHQFGTEDQGWVAHFLIQTIKEQKIILYGDGRQVRDILFIDDLINAFLLAQKNIYKLSGQVFNIGGGQENTTSLVEFIELIGKIHGKKPSVDFDNWRPGDQRYYVSDSSKFQAATSWRPQINIHQGIQNLYQWLLEKEHTNKTLPRLSPSYSKIKK
ncbi:MAG TPA: GDP-mannose 4,6-dehydratase [Candidatus Sericytochromatia bacterium]